MYKRQLVGVVDLFEEGPHSGIDRGEVVGHQPAEDTQQDEKRNLVEPECVVEMCIRDRLGAVLQRESEVEDPAPDDMYKVGTAARIIKILETVSYTHLS